MVSWMGELTRVKQGPGVTLHCVQQMADKAEHGGRLCLQLEGGGYLLGGIDVRWAHGLPRKLTEGVGPSPRL